MIGEPCNPVVNPSFEMALFSSDYTSTDSPHHSFPEYYRNGSINQLCKIHLPMNIHFRHGRFDLISHCINRHFSLI